MKRDFDQEDWLLWLALALLLLSVSCATGAQLQSPKGVTHDHNAPMVQPKTVSLRLLVKSPQSVPALQSPRASSDQKNAVSVSSQPFWTYSQDVSRVKEFRIRFWRTGELKTNVARVVPPLESVAVGNLVPGADYRFLALAVSASGVESATSKLITYRAPRH
jgi:hypothetical protein